MVVYGYNTLYVADILTLMCFLESHPNKFIQLKHRVYGTATVKCYGGPSQFAVSYRALNCNVTYILTVVS